MNPRRISRTGVDGTTSFHSVISENSTPDLNDNIGTRINGINVTTTPSPIGISETSADPPTGGIWSPSIGNIRQSTSPNLIKSDELNASVDGRFSNNPIAPPVLAELFSDKLSNSSISYLYACCGVHLSTDTSNPMAPQLFNHSLSAANALNKGAEIWIPATRIRNLPVVTHWSAAGRTVGKSAAVGDTVGKKSHYSEENYKSDFKIWMGDSKLQFERKNIERGQPTLYSTPFGAKYQTQKHQHRTLQHVN